MQYYAKANQGLVGDLRFCSMPTSIMSAGLTIGTTSRHIFTPCIFPFPLNSPFKVHVNHCFSSADDPLIGPWSCVLRDKKGDTRGPTFHMDHTNHGFCDLQQSLYKSGTLVSSYHKKVADGLEKYFMWYLWFLPLVLPHLNLSRSKAIFLLVLWVGSQVRQYIQPG
jgi:hypothetical protein